VNVDRMTVAPIDPAGSRRAPSGRITTSTAPGGAPAGDAIGPHGWIRRGLSYEEAVEKRRAEMPAGVKFHQVVDLDGLAAKAGAGNFCVCALGGQMAFALGCLEPADEDLPFIQRMIQDGKLFVKSTLYSYPEYPLVYIRMFVPSAPPESPTKMRGELLECLADYTEANFQEWVVAVCAAGKFTVNIRRPDGSALAKGLVQLEGHFTDDLLKAMNKADAELRRIPEERRSPQAASASFYDDHPVGFLFE
jgi:hypothetical protein